MEFFNKKEEVLDFQLTEYGKYLLSEGMLVPAYYAFFDDEILYNVEYADDFGAKAGIRGEAQNKADRRIRYDTPNLKVIASRSGAQTRVDAFLENVTASQWQANSDPANKVENFSIQQPFEDKANIASFPLGSSALTSKYDAAWSVNLLNRNFTTISSSVGYMVSNLTSSYITGTLNGIIKEIPQLNIDLDYQTYFAKPEDPLGVSNIFTSSVGGPPVKLALEKNYLVLDVLEKNSVFEKENFDIEVYHITDDNKLTPLSFLQEGNETSDPVSLLSGEGANVEYYMNIYFDQNLPMNVLGELGLTKRDVLVNSNRINLVRDIYTTEDEEPC